MSPHEYKPVWAGERMPTLGTLQYLQAASAAILLGLALLWVLAAVVHDPRAIIRIGRKQVGA